MYIAILGRQPALGMAELERLNSSDNVKWFSDQSALVHANAFSINHIGGTLKAGRVVAELHGDWRQASTKIVQAYSQAWSNTEGKITLGISAYGFDVSARDVQKTGIVLKQKLKKTSTSLRLIPNAEPALNTATSHHNKLGLSENKVELLVIRARNGRVVVAESVGAQNITALARRDQGRPKRDAFVGMLPPKLAQIMINLTTPLSSSSEGEDVTSDQNKALRILDPFCGTGVILQEAALMGYSVYGTDLSDKMIDFSQANLQWLADSHHVNINATIHQGDAMDTKWQQPIDAVACEGYLGQPFSAPPSPDKLEQVKRNCDHIMSEFLKNIAGQLEPSTPLCVAVPAWRDAAGRVTHLPLIKKLEQLGFVQHDFKNVRPDDLLYYREDQVVARELLVLTKA
jgi:tRNA G10  N-methylase Trm11